MSAKVRIVVMDDHILFREGVARLLAGEPDFEFIVGCASLGELIDALRHTPVDVLLLDFDLGSLNGIEVLKRIAEEKLQTRVLVVTAGVSVEQAREMLRLGATGIFVKHNSPALLAQAIRQVAQGGTAIDLRYLRSLLADTSSDTEPASLTPRERQVLRGILSGQGNKQIGAELSVSESAVKAVLQQLFHKTGVRTRSQLVRVALEKYRDEL